ncbi:MAG: Fe-S cluster assembly protein SufD [Cyclobacteriaceae bacterium]
MMAETSAPQNKLQDLFERSGEVAVGTSEARKKAYDYLQDNGLPGKRDEEYRYTPLTRIVEKQFDLATDLDSAFESDLDPSPFFVPEASGHRVVFINGIYSAKYSQVGNGLQVSTLNESEDTELLEQYYGKHPFAAEDSWAALNTSLSREGLVIKAGTDHKAGSPLYIYYLTDGRSQKTASQIHHLILAERSANLQVVEVFGGTGDNASFVNTATEVIVRDNARVEHYKLGLDSEETIHAGHTMVHQGRDSHYHNVTINLTGGVVRNNMNVVQDAENCETHMIGLYLLHGKQHIDNHTVVDHRKPNSYSNELYKGVMADKSMAVFNGKIFVRQEAQKTNAFQSNKNLLLSDNATVNTKPQLEIWADDVKCSHGATTGQVDKEQVFYLMSRGLSREHARAMLLGAFASEVTEQITIEPLRNYVEGIVNDRLTV